MRACVTGGAGLVGSHLVDHLLFYGYEVRILDNLEPVTHGGARPAWITDDAEFVYGDVRFPPDCRRAVAGCDVVFHQAAYGGFDPEAHVKMTETNALGTVNVMDACRHAGVAKVIVASSQAVYGHGLAHCHVEDDHVGAASRTPLQLASGEWQPRCSYLGVSGSRCLYPADVWPVHEDDAPAPCSIYALSKLYAERAALELGAEWGLPVVALRYALTYGPRQSTSNPYTGICSIFSTAMLEGRPVVIHEDGRQTRDFTYVGDVARANLLVAELDGPEVDGHVFNVGTGVATTVRAFVHDLAAAYGVAPAVTAAGTFRAGDARHLVTDASKLRAIGWHPQVELSEGVRAYADWIRSCR